MCCGQKRQAQASSPHAPVAKPTPVMPTSYQYFRPAPATISGVEFEYTGGRVLSVTGQGTGRQYRFAGYGARLVVDARDRASLAAVPQLRALPGTGR